MNKYEKEYVLECADMNNPEIAELVRQIKYLEKQKTK